MLCALGESFSLSVMTDKQAVLDLLRRLPETASLDGISEELRIMTAIRQGRADVATGRTKTHEEVTQRFDDRASNR